MTATLSGHNHGARAISGRIRTRSPHLRRAFADRFPPRQAVCLAAVALGALLPVTAAAAPPVADRFPVDGEFDSAPLSDACGVPVTIGFAGTFAIRVFSAPGGVVREIDTQPGTKVTFRSDAGAISMPFSGVLHTTYPEGAVVGAPAHLVLTGRSFGTDPFVGAGRGRLVFEGFVAAVEDGFPLTRFTELSSISGEFVRDTDRICAVLAP